MKRGTPKIFPYLRMKLIRPCKDVSKNFTSFYRNLRTCLKEHCKLLFWIMAILELNIIRKTKLAIVVSIWNNTTRPFMKRKQISTGAAKGVRKVLCSYLSALMLICFHLMKSHVSLFQSQTTVTSFLHLTVLISKVYISQM